MKFAVHFQHRDYFNKQGFIEFQDLLSPAQLDPLNHSIQEVLAQRMNIPVIGLSEAQPQLLFLQGYDLWRSNPTIRKTVASPKLAEIASELTQQQPLRLGFDEYFPSPLNYLELLKQGDLNGLSCIQGIVCGLMLCLKGPAVESPTTAAASSIFSRIPGHAVFFHPTSPIDLQELGSNSEYAYLLITYVKSNAVYTFQPNDPHTHALKQWGYSFGDKLSDKLNPILTK